MKETRTTRTGSVICVLCMQWFTNTQALFCGAYMLLLCFVFLSFANIFFVYYTIVYCIIDGKENNGQLNIVVKVEGIAIEDTVNF